MPKLRTEAPAARTERSKRRTRSPRRTAARALARPTMPPPIMATSTTGFILAILRVVAAAAAEAEWSFHGPRVCREQRSGRAAGWDRAIDRACGAKLRRPFAPRAFGRWSRGGQTSIPAEDRRNRPERYRPGCEL